MPRMKEMTLYASVKKEAERLPGGTALLYMGAKIDYRRLMKEIDRTAAQLAALGVKAGTPVTVCMPNIPQVVALFYAISKLGAIAHLVHPLSPEPQLEKYMRSVGSNLLCVTDIFAENYKGLIWSGNIRTMLCSPAHFLSPVKRAVFTASNRKKIELARSLPNVLFYGHGVEKNQKIDEFTDADAPAVYLHSGGTGGEPKTIILSSRAINALCENCYDILGITEFHGGCMLAVLPTFHGFGLAMGMHAMLCHGGTDTLMPKFHTRETIKLIERGKINYLIGVPALYEALLSRPEFSGKKLRNLRQAFVGGDYVPKSLLERFDERMRSSGSDARLFEGYGLTETVTVCSVNTTAAHRDRSVGRALGGMEIAAFDGEKRLAPGECGELCVAGDELMIGYLGDPDDRAGVFFESDGKRFVRTGDLGYVDGDGYVFFRSRIKRLAKVNGVPVFPSEIEKLVMDERPEVKEACAVALPDERKGGAIGLFVIMKSTMTEAGRAAEERELCAFIERSLGPFSRPDRVVFTDSFPQTPVGKVDYNALVASIAPDPQTADER